MIMPPFDFYNPKPDDLYEMVDKLIRLAGTNKGQPVFETVAKLSDREYQLSNRHIKKINGILTGMSAKASDLSNVSLSIELRNIKYFGHFDDRPGFLKNAEEAKEDAGWINELIIEVIRHR